MLIDYDKYMELLDRHIKLKDKYESALKTAEYFKSEYNSIFDWLNDNEPDILEDYLNSKQGDNKNA